MLEIEGGRFGNQQEAKVFQTRPDILHSQPITSEFGESDIEQGGGGMRLNKFNIQSPTIIRPEIGDKLCDFDIFCLKCR